MDLGFLEKLDVLRAAFGRPLALSSAYRCPAHNAAVSKTGERGPHTTGKAVDILAHGPDAVTLLRLASQQGFTGIGVSQRGFSGSRFLHVDMLSASEGFPRPNLWSY